MNKFLSLLAVASVVAISSVSFAEDKATTTPTPAATPAVASAIQTQTKPISAELQDGSKIEIANDGVVSVLNADGTKTAAPDGTLTLKDGVSLVVKAGKKVSQ